MYFENSKCFVNSRNNDDSATKITQLIEIWIKTQKLNSDARTDDINKVHFGISNQLPKKLGQHT